MNHAISQAYEELTQRFTNWAQTVNSIRAVFVIGSRARRDHPADQWSDLDLVIITHDPGMIIDSAEWVKQVGTPWLTFLEPNSDRSGLERRVLFEGGLELDFSPFPVNLIEQFIEKGLPPSANEVFRRGFRILIDKDDLARQIPALIHDQPVASLPTQNDFLQVENDFWYHAVWTAKHLRRGELWWAKSGCDDHLKGLLRTMLQWHAHARHKGKVDTWIRGRFLEEWADPRALEELKSTFAHYDPEDVWHALFATMRLFRWLGQETAQTLGLSYPQHGDEKATALVNDLFATRT